MYIITIKNSKSHLDSQKKVEDRFQQKIVVDAQVSKEIAKQKKGNQELFD